MLLIGHDNFLKCAQVVKYRCSRPSFHVLVMQYTRCCGEWVWLVRLYHSMVSVLPHFSDKAAHSHFSPHNLLQLGNHTSQHHESHAKANELCELIGACC